MGAFDAFGALRPYLVWEGVEARALHGERITMALVDLAPGAVVATHAHENEQLGFVLSGELTFDIGGVERRLAPGETYVIAPNVPHQATAGPGGCTVVDVFSPPRADWENLERMDPSPGRWPKGS